jgi:hypothetical protein
MSLPGVNGPQFDGAGQPKGAPGAFHQTLEGASGDGLPEAGGAPGGVRADAPAPSASSSAPLTTLELAAQLQPGGIYEYNDPAVSRAMELVESPYRRIDRDDGIPDRTANRCMACIEGFRAAHSEVGGLIVVYAGPLTSGGAELAGRLAKARPLHTSVINVATMPVSSKSVENQIARMSGTLPFRFRYPNLTEDPVVDRLIGILDAEFMAVLRAGYRSLSDFDEAMRKTLSNKHRDTLIVRGDPVLSDQPTDQLILGHLMARKANGERVGLLVLYPHEEVNGYPPLLPQFAITAGDMGVRVMRMGVHDPYIG